MISKKLKLIRRLKRILSPGEIVFDPQTLEKYATDKWFASHAPDAVALPRSTKSVSALLRFANRHKIPLPPVVAATATPVVACPFMAALCFHSNA